MFFLLLVTQLGAAPVGLSLGPTPVPPGAAVPVHVDVARDGYLLVLRATTDGRVAVVFEGFVARGVHQLRGPGNRQALIADASGGTGLLLAALSATPPRVGAGGLAASYDDVAGPDVLTAVARRALGEGWLGGAFALYTVRAGWRPAAAVARVGSPPDSGLRPGIGMCQGCTIVVQAAAPPVTALPVAERRSIERTLLVASVCDVGVGSCLPSGFRPRRPPKREPPVKTSGICQTGVDCPPGVGAPAKTLPRK
jgi:hypothetical protein